MKYSHPAAIHGYFYVCNNCKNDDGRPVLKWEGDSEFSLCMVCLSNLYFEYVAPKDKLGEAVLVKRRYISEKLRNKIFNRDGNKCVKCGSIKNLEIDHIIAFSKGGKTKEGNLQTLCKKCNLRKRDK